MEEITITVTLKSQNEFTPSELRTQLRQAADNINHWADLLYKEDRARDFIAELEENDGLYGLEVEQTGPSSYRSKGKSLQAVRKLSAPIHIWRFHDAPEEIKKLSEHGGDEDWIALIDNEFKEENGIPLFLETGPFVICDYSEHEFGGHTVIISSHA